MALVTHAPSSHWACAIKTPSDLGQKILPDRRELMLTGFSIILRNILADAMYVIEAPYQEDMV